jgi:hypothetical protein
MANKLILFFAIGLIIGLLLYDRFLVPEIETKVEYIETIKIDTVYTVVRDTIYRDNFKYIYERDTIIEDYKPKIRGFKETYTTPYGNVYLSGEVLGELRYASLTTDFKFPNIVSTIIKEKKTTSVIKPSGVYLTGGINSNFSYSIGATYLNDKSLIGYEYQPQIDLHSLRVGWMLF